MFVFVFSFSQPPGQRPACWPGGLFHKLESSTEAKLLYLPLDTVRACSIAASFNGAASRSEAAFACKSLICFANPSLRSKRTSNCFAIRAPPKAEVPKAQPSPKAKYSEGIAERSSAGLRSNPRRKGAFCEQNASNCRERSELLLLARRVKER